MNFGSSTSLLLCKSRRLKCTRPSKIPIGNSVKILFDSDKLSSASKDANI